MCPGGIIAPASTDAGELVVNGWSPSKRNNPFANSGMVASVEMQDIAAATKNMDIKSKSHVQNPLSAMYFQQAVEKRLMNMVVANL